MVPQTFGLIRDVFPPQHLGKAFAAFGPVIGLSTVLGPVVAGLLLEADLFGSGWRSLFWLNLPLCAVALVCGPRVLPAGAPRRHGLRLDGVGTVLLGTASFLLVFPLVDGRDAGVAGLGVRRAASRLAARCSALFVVHQRGAAAGRADDAGGGQRAAQALLRLRRRLHLVLLRQHRRVRLAIGLFLQLGLGFGPMHAALYLAALAVGAFVGSGVGAWAATAVGRPILHVGLS